MNIYLKDLRTRVGESVRSAASTAGLRTPSAWKHYEDDGERKELPADIVIKLLQNWSGLGDPEVHPDEILELNSGLKSLFKDTSHNLNTAVDIEADNVSIQLTINARSYDDLHAVIERYVKALQAIKK